MTFAVMYHAGEMGPTRVSPNLNFCVKLPVNCTGDFFGERKKNDIPTPHEFQNLKSLVSSMKFIKTVTFCL